MKKRLMKVIRSRVTASLVYILLGLCLVLVPVATVNIIYKVVFGVVMVSVGLSHIYVYLKDGGSGTLLDMFSGSILVVLGAFLFSNPQIVVKLLPLLLGMFVLVDSVWSIQAAFRMKKNNLSAWTFVMICNLVFVALGIVSMINPFSERKYTIFFSGGVLLGNGIADVIYLLLLRYWKKTIPSGEEELSDGKSENSVQGETQGTGADTDGQKFQGTGAGTSGQELQGTSGGTSGQGIQGTGENPGGQGIQGTGADTSGQEFQKTGRKSEEESQKGMSLEADAEEGPAEDLKKGDGKDKEEEEILEEWKDL